MSSGKPHTRIEIRVSCNKLKNKDIGSKSDPCCVMYQKVDDNWTEVLWTLICNILRDSLFNQVNVRSIT